MNPLKASSNSSQPLSTGLELFPESLENFQWLFPALSTGLELFPESLEDFQWLFQALSTGLELFP